MSVLCIKDDQSAIRCFLV